jgi:hypothetical protein
LGLGRSVHQIETYEVSRPTRPEFGPAFFGFSALRFMVAVIAGLAFALAADLNSVSDASVRCRENMEPLLKSELLATNKPHAALDLTVWNAALTAMPRKYQGNTKQTPGKRQGICHCSRSG